MSTNLDNIARLAKMKEAGMLTEEEFKIHKQRLLNI